MAGSRELLDSLKPGMHLDKNFFLKVYGHEITSPGFAENVIKRLEILGCSKAREYYTCVVTEFEYKHEQEISCRCYFRKASGKSEETQIIEMNQ